MLFHYFNIKNIVNEGGEGGGAREEGTE